MRVSVGWRSTVDGDLDQIWPMWVLRLAAQAFAEACSSLLGLGQIAFAFWTSFIGNCICVLSQIFLYSYIIKASPRLTLYRLKDKKGVERLTLPYRLKNYDNWTLITIKQMSLAFLYHSNVATKVQWTVVALYSFNPLNHEVQYNTTLLSNISITNKSYTMLSCKKIYICPLLPINFPMTNREAILHSKQ
jgi:hypothetical protein